MRDPLDIPDVVRLSVPLKLRVPVGFRERVVSVAAAEGIGFAEFTRRAIVERVRRLEAAEAKTDQSPASAATSPPSANTLSARAAGTPTTSGASASAAAKPNRRDA